VLRALATAGAAARPDARSWSGGGVHCSEGTAQPCRCTNPAAAASLQHSQDNILRSYIKHEMTAEDYPLRFSHKVLF